MRHWILSLFASWALLVCGATCGEAEDSENPTQELQVRIDQINGEIDIEGRALEDIDQKIAELDQQFKLLRNDSDKLKSEEKELTKRLAEISGERTQVKTDLEDLTRQAERRKELSMRRIRAGYMHPPEQAIMDLFRDTTSRSFSHFGLYLTTIRSYDRRMIDEVVELKRSRTEKARELEELTERQQKVAQDLRLRREIISKKVAEQEPVVKQLKSQRADREEIVVHLRAQLLRFETVLAGLTGGADERPDSPRVRLKQPAQGASNTPFDGEGLLGSKGELVPPVEGRVVIPFGKQVAATNGIAGVSKGLEIASEAGASVRALAKGKVIYTGRMPVLGTILIVDHGERYYSLYGRLGRVIPGVGAVVDAQEQVGEVGPAEQDGRNFYFEIRKNGIPVDPSPFFNRKM